MHIYKINIPYYNVYTSFWDFLYVQSIIMLNVMLITYFDSLKKHQSAHTYNVFRKYAA